MKKFLRNVHLWLGIASGAVISVVCLTGAILVFEAELQQVIYPERFAVTPRGERLPLEQLERVVREMAVEGGAEPASVRLYRDRERTVAGQQDINDCMRLMTDKRIRHLPVLSGERVVGILSIGDLVRAVIEEQERTIADLETYIHG